MKLSVIIPVYNEAATVEALIRKVQAAPLDGLQREIIVVDDCSTDGTRERLQRLDGDIRLICQPHNQGKGAAVRRGFDAATGEILLIQDADLEYDPNDYRALIAPIVSGQADAVMGSRFLMEQPRFFTKDGDPFFSHYVGNRTIIWLTNWLYGFQATDYGGCYKAFSREAIRATPIQATGFELDIELICKLLRRKWRIVEIPIHYSPRLYHEGKKIRWQHGIGIMWNILKWRVAPF